MTPPIVGTQVRLNGAWVPLGASIPPPPPPSGAFPGDPGVGKMIWAQGRQGGMSAMAARAATFASDVGRSGHLYPGGGRIYITPFGTVAEGVSLANGALDDAAIVKAWGGMPFIDFKELTGASFAQVAAGSNDQVFDTVCEGAVAMNWPIILGYHQEPVTDSKGTATDYANAVNRLAQRRDLAGGQGIISVTGCIGLGSFANATTAVSKDNNGTFKDWAAALSQTGQDVWGSHKYLQYTSQADTKWTGGWSMQTLFGQFWDVQDTYDNTKARVHGEWGVHTAAVNPAISQQFMDQMLTYGISHNLRWCSYFDSGLNVNNGGSWQLDSPVQGATLPNGNADTSPETSRRVHFANQLLDPRCVFPSAI